MNVYEKLQHCRVELQKENLKKSGQNKFSGYDYFELGDFLPQINQLFFDNKLFGYVTFDIDYAYLTIINTEKPDELIIFKSPMKDAQLKGCHDIQNLGAVETYQRRYLYMMALEIVEQDALEPVTGKEDKPSVKKDKPKTVSEKAYICADCKAQITDAEMSYSVNKFGKALCRKCQKGAK